MIGFSDTRDIRRLRRGGATLLALALLPGWILPPECGACPHMGHEEVVSEADPAAGEHQASASGSHSHDHQHPDAEAAADADAVQDVASEHPGSHGDEGCGCPCDVQCAAPGLPAEDTRVATAAHDTETHVARIVATRLRPADMPHPPFFIPFSNAPPR